MTYTCIVFMKFVLNLKNIIFNFLDISTKFPNLKKLMTTTSVVTLTSYVGLISSRRIQRRLDMCLLIFSLGMFKKTPFFAHFLTRCKKRVFFAHFFKLCVKKTLFLTLYKKSLFYTLKYENVAKLF